MTMTIALHRKTANVLDPKVLFAQAMQGALAGAIAGSRRSLDDATLQGVAQGAAIGALGGMLGGSVQGGMAGGNLSSPNNAGALIGGALGGFLGSRGPRGESRPDLHLRLDRGTGAPVPQQQEKRAFNVRRGFKAVVERAKRLKTNPGYRRGRWSEESLGRSADLFSLGLERKYGPAAKKALIAGGTLGAGAAVYKATRREKEASEARDLQRAQSQMRKDKAQERGQRAGLALRRHLEENRGLSSVTKGMREAADTVAAAPGALSAFHRALTKGAGSLKATKVKGLRRERPQVSCKTAALGLGVEVAHRGRLGLNVGFPHGVAGTYRLGDDEWAPHVGIGLTGPQIGISYRGKQNKQKAKKTTIRKTAALSDKAKQNLALLAMLSAPTVGMSLGQAAGAERGQRVRGLVRGAAGGAMGTAGFLGPMMLSPGRPRTLTMAALSAMVTGSAGAVAGDELGKKLQKRWDSRQKTAGEKTALSRALARRASARAAEKAEDIGSKLLFTPSGPSSWGSDSRARDAAKALVKKKENQSSLFSQYARGKTAGEKTAISDELANRVADKRWENLQSAKDRFGYGAKQTTETMGKATRNASLNVNRLMGKMKSAPWTGAQPSVKRTGGILGSRGARVGAGLAAGGLLAAGAYAAHKSRQEKRASAASHAVELAGLGILAAPAVAGLTGRHMSEKNKDRAELAGLGVLAAPSALSLARSGFAKGRGLVSRMRRAK